MILEAAKVTLRQSKRFRTVAHANDCIQDILEGLSELHKNGVVHLDIKPENIFLISDRHNSTEVRWRSCRSSARLASCVGPFMLLIRGHWNMAVQQ